MAASKKKRKKIEEEEENQKRAHTERENIRFNALLIRTQCLESLHLVFPAIDQMRPPHTLWIAGQMEEREMCHNGHAAERTVSAISCLSPMENHTET